jgi:hypothetical protein
MLTDDAQGVDEISRGWMRGQDGSWKVGLMHTVPFPDQSDG